jgi:hypothetical protein
VVFPPLVSCLYTLPKLLACQFGIFDPQQFQIQVLKEEHCRGCPLPSMFDTLTRPLQACFFQHLCLWCTGGYKHENVIQLQLKSISCHYFSLHVAVFLTPNGGVTCPAISTSDPAAPILAVLIRRRERSDSRVRVDAGLGAGEFLRLQVLVQKIYRSFPSELSCLLIIGIHSIFFEKPVPGPFINVGCERPSGYFHVLL